MIIAGIDEAGRGPVLGPLVVGISVISKDAESKLVKLGVKDSKLLAEKKRYEMEPKLRKALLEYSVLAVQPKEIDALMARRSLNEIEAMKMGALINGLKSKPDVIYIDCPDIIPETFIRRLKKYCDTDARIVAEHKADQKYPIVSAASVLAKVSRDTEIKLLCKKYGELGSGYPHDELTVSFLKDFMDKNNCLPPIARKSWDTARRAEAQKMQSKLSEYKE